MKLRRWIIKDLDLIEGVQPDTVIETAIRTAQGNLSDTIEAFLADPANAPRAGVVWPALKANIETLLLGDAYAEVLRCEHRTIHQKAHKDTTVYSERYLASAKAAYVEPWDAVTNQMLIAHFAEGLIDQRMARDVGVVLRKGTLIETIHQTRLYAGIEASMNLHDCHTGDVAAVAPVETEEAKKKKKSETDIEDKRYKALDKQIAAVSTQLGEFRAGTRKPAREGGIECYNCHKIGHYARDCRGTSRGRGPPRGRQSTPRSTECYNSGQNGHFARDCQVRTSAPSRGRGGPQRGRGAHHHP